MIWFVLFQIFRGLVGTARYCDSKQREATSLPNHAQAKVKHNMISTLLWYTVLYHWPLIMHTSLYISNLLASFLDCLSNSTAANILPLGVSTPSCVLLIDTLVSRWSAFSVRAGTIDRWKFCEEKVKGRCGLYLWKSGYVCLVMQCVATEWKHYSID